MDKEFDQLYFNVSNRSEGGEVAQTVEAMTGVNLDSDEDGRLVGVEITGVTDLIGAPAGEVDFSGELVSVKEAAELASKDKGNFLRDLASSGDFPKPVVTLASRRYWLFGEIEQYFRNERVAR